MKKVLLTLVALVAFTSMALAHNETVGANASFTCKVISPLTWNQVSDVVLQDVIAGQTRNYTGKDMTFTLTGEADYAVTITRTITAGTGNDAGVTLTGAWDVAIPTALSGSGTASMKYSATGVTAPATAHGMQSWTVAVTAQYTSI